MIAFFMQLQNCNILKNESKYQACLSSSHLNAHLTFPLFSEKSPSYYLFVVKKTFQKCNPPDFKFYPKKLTNKIFPKCCNVNFESSSLFKQYKKAKQI